MTILIVTCKSAREAQKLANLIADHSDQDLTDLIVTEEVDLENLDDMALDESLTRP